MIQGRGFFQVRQASGDLAYTRAGSFHLDRDGNLVTSDGDPIEPPITVPPDALTITISADGTVSFMQPGQTAAQFGGQIQLASFQNPAGLSSIGRNLYTPTDASGDAIIGTPGGQEGMGALLQGYLEDSNVSVVQEFINMIVAQRAYEANSKVVQSRGRDVPAGQQPDAMMWTALTLTFAVQIAGLSAGDRRRDPRRRPGAGRAGVCGRAGRHARRLRARARRHAHL